MIMTDKIKRKPGLDLTQMDGEWIVLDADLCIVTRLNEVGGRIMELLDQELLPGQIAERIAAEYEITTEQAHADLEKFLNTLNEANLLDKRYEG
ncbi:MAG: PqqD family protein [Paenibacillus sp.]|nr:PqqD family protein [Paenibacillus sp.]